VKREAEEDWGKERWRWATRTHFAFASTCGRMTATTSLSTWRCGAKGSQNCDLFWPSVAERNRGDCNQLVSPEERAMKKDDHQKGHSRKNTANIGGAAYAPQQDEPHSKGDARTPNKPIGEVAYANRDPTKKKTGKS